MVRPRAPDREWDDVVVLDSGGYTVKFGLASEPTAVRSVPNCAARLKGDRAAYVADAVLSCRDAASLAVRRPVDRGYTTNWALQRDVWARVVQGLLGVGPASARSRLLLLTEPAFSLPTLREAAARVALEDLGFGGVAFVTPAELVVRALSSRASGLGPTLFAPIGTETGPPPASTALALEARCALIVDCGFSFTHITPVFDGLPVQRGVVRIDLGGKVMTNHMKDVLSYRSINVQGEPLLVDHVKEELCFVSRDPLADLALANRRDSPHLREYILPDGVRETWGHIRGTPGAREPDPGDAVLLVNNERFMVPELLFRPSDIGLDECGLAEAAARAVTKVHPHLHALLWANVVVVGGGARLPGLAARLVAELRPFVPDTYVLHVRTLADPVTAAWRGGVDLATSPADLAPRIVTPAAFAELGVGALATAELAGLRVEVPHA